jgi:hypothetical protein
VLKGGLENVDCSVDEHLDGLAGGFRTPCNPQGCLVKYEINTRRHLINQALVTNIAFNQHHARMFERRCEVT